MSGRSDADLAGVGNNDYSTNTSKVQQKSSGGRLRLMKQVYVAVAFIFSLIVFAILGLGLIFFTFQGKSEQFSEVSERIRSELQTIAGERFRVDLRDVDLDLSNIGLLQFNMGGIDIINRRTGAVFVQIGKLKVRKRVRDIFLGRDGFDQIFISDVSINIKNLVMKNDYGLPRYLDEPLDYIGISLSRMNEVFSTGRLRDIEILNVTVTGSVLGRISDKAVHLPALKIVPGLDNKNGFAITGKLDTDISSISFFANYRDLDTQNTASVLDFGLNGLNLLEWFNDPATQEGILGLDASAQIAGQLWFDSLGNAQDPKIRILVSSGRLRIGDDARTNFNSAELNLRIFLDRNQIELDPSVVSVGDMTAILIGGLKPQDDIAGYGGPILYDIILEYGGKNSPDDNPKIIHAGMKFSGIYDAAAQRIDVDRMFLTTKRGAIEGTGEIGLGDKSPSIRAEARTKGISVAVLKQFWPFFVADDARDWVLNHVGDGWIKTGMLIADIPPGVVFELEQGAKLGPEDYKLSIEVENLDFRPFGELPRIVEANGSVELIGMSVAGTLKSGKSMVEEKGGIVVESGNFFMPDFEANERIGEINIAVSGAIGEIAAISDREPLRVMKRLDVTARQFSGKAHANVAARFPIRDTVEYQEVEWNALLELQGGKSSKKLFGRMLSDANVLIDANPAAANITGTMTIDGVSSKVKLIEPIGNSGALKRKYDVRATLDTDDFDSIGINFSPVVEGPVGIKITKENGLEQYQLDFTNATLNLPWVNWSKGRGIKGVSTFNLERLKKGRMRLTDMKLSGPGFYSKGTMTLDREGLAHADFSQVELNQGDAFGIRIERGDNVYNINASGRAYDARGIINLLIHIGGFGESKNDASVSLVANFDTVRGFGNREMRNAVILYESEHGQLKRLDMKATDRRGSQYAAQAQLNGNETLFNIETSDAGTALAFTDIYTRMEGGKLQARLIRNGSGPFTGRVEIRVFEVVDEPRLERMSSRVRKQVKKRFENRIREQIKAQGNRVKFQLADARIEKRKGLLKINDAIIQNNNFGIAMEGIIYDKNDHMNVTGTFMMANGLNIVMSNIPLLGQLLADGRSTALFGVTYKLYGPRKNPKLLINPLSAIAPGIFKKIFEFR